MPKTPSALVTGSSGLVGSHLCRILAEHGWRVVGATRQSHAKSIQGVVHACLPFHCDEDRWRSALNTVDCVVHLAGRVHQMGAAAQNAAAFHEANVLGSRFVAEQAAQAGVRRFIFLSTIKVNGEGGDGRAYRADDPPNPSDCYSKSKLAAEQTLRALCLVAGMEFVVIRSPLVYGPGVRANFARLLDLAALGLPLPLLSIDNRRSFVGVWNLADFIEICMTHPHANGKTWLISDGEDLSTPDLVRRLARLMHKPARLFSFSPRLLQRLSALFGMSEEVSRLCDSLCIDASPTFRQLNWQPRVSVDEGLARTVAAYQESHGP